MSSVPRHRSEPFAAERRRKEARLARARSMARIASWEWSLETDLFHCDPELLQIFDCKRYSAGDQVTALLARVHPSDRARVEQVWKRRCPHQMEYRILLDGQVRPRVLRQEAELAQDEANGEVRLVGIVQDITPLKEAEKKVSRLAYFDTLTGLPNRAFLQHYLLRVIADAHRKRGAFALMVLDLDLFKRINDTLGHAAGDKLLKEVARRISSAVRSTDVIATGTQDLQELSYEGSSVARLGGDEFIVVLDDLRFPSDAGVVAERIAEALSLGVDINGTEVFIGCSIGIAIYPTNGTTPDVLMKHADSAMYCAKEQGRNKHLFFEDAMDQVARRRLVLENGIRTALGNREFILYYQPKIDLASGRTVGVEALLRWPTPNGMISAAEFIPVAEDTGLIVPLGAWVLRTACRQGKAWLDRGWELPIAVNVSGRQFRESGFADLLEACLNDAGLPARLLEVEITEGVIMHDTVGGIETLKRLKELGVRISIDDFGTGYSSLAYLSRFPIDTLKIDRSFVRELGRTRTGEAIASAVIALASALSLDVIAEGVETKRQAEFLLSRRCSKSQGFAFCRPVPPEQVALSYVPAYLEDDTST